MLHTNAQDSVFRDLLGCLMPHAPTYFLTRISLIFKYDEDKGISFTEQEKWYVIKLLFSVLSFELTDYRVFY